jgi:DNA-binding transcriptional LysR family regulator
MLTRPIFDLQSEFAYLQILEDWNDLRLVLNVARTGSLRGAAAALRINHSTAYRRLQALESGLGQRLFERFSGTYRTTETGERLAVAAERIEAETLALDRTLTGRDPRLSGRLRITASETVAHRVLPELLAEFRTRHPGIRLELLVDNRQLDLSRREADIALRATRPAAPDLFGRKLADIAWTIYGTASYLAQRGSGTASSDLAQHDFIGWDDSADVAAAAWLAAAIPESAVIYRSSSLLHQLNAAKAGIGLAVLPCYLADAEPDLRRVLPPIPALTRELWLITHEDLRTTARVRAFFDLVGDALQRRPIFALPPDGAER